MNFRQSNFRRNDSRHVLLEFVIEVATSFLVDLDEEKLKAYDDLRTESSVGSSPTTTIPSPNPNGEMGHIKKSKSVSLFMNKIAVKKESSFSRTKSEIFVETEQGTDGKVQVEIQKKSRFLKILQSIKNKFSKRKSPSKSTSPDSEKKVVDENTLTQLANQIAETRDTVREVVEYFYTIWRLHPRVLVLAIMYLEKLKQVTSKNKSPQMEADATHPEYVKNKNAKKHVCDKEEMCCLNLKHFKLVFGACCVIASKIYEEKFWKNSDYYGKICMNGGDFHYSQEKFNVTERCIVNCILQFHLNYSEQQYRDFIASHWEYINETRKRMHGTHSRENSGDSTFGGGGSCTDRTEAGSSNRLAARQPQQQPIPKSPRRFTLFT